jgi:hypothetical protein
MSMSKFSIVIKLILIQNRKFTFKAVVVAMVNMKDVYTVYVCVCVCRGEGVGSVNIPRAS